MKKLLILFLSVLMVTSCAIGLTACHTQENNSEVPPGHTHSYAYNYNTSKHYLECLCGNIKDSKNHNLTNGACKTCGYVRKEYTQISAVQIPSKENQFVTGNSWPLNLNGYKTNISDAKALGIASVNSTSANPYSTKKGSKKVSLFSKGATLYTDDVENEKKYIVKSTSDYTYNDPTFNDNGIEKITFTKTITDEVATDIRGSKYLIAKPDMTTAKATLSFACDEDKSYCVYLNDEVIFETVTDNCELDINTEVGIISLLDVESGVKYKVKTIKEKNNKENENKENKENGNEEDTNEVNAQMIIAEDDILTAKCSISFNPIINYNYSLYLDGSLVYEKLEDNSEIDIDSEEGVITISGLEKDKEYEVRYEYYKSEIVITQEEIAGEIDKLYVLGDYTFISYVPENTSNRPSNENLTYDTDGIATYDKCDYFSNNNRRSFIIDNTTGYVYDIKGFNIKEIQGGLLLSQNDNYIYDFKINENDEVEIFSLFTNDSIKWYSCFKDKYGNSYIQNNRVTTYDSSTKTYFYIYEECNYELTSTGEAIKLIWHNKINKYYGILSHASIMLANGQERNLTVNDNFDIIYKIRIGEEDYGYVHHSYYKVEKGVAYGRNIERFYNSNTWRYEIDGYCGDVIRLLQYDAINDLSYCREMYSNGLYNLDYIEKYNIVLFYGNGKVYYFDDVWKNFRTTAQKIDDGWNYSWIDGYSDNLWDDYWNGLIDVEPSIMTILDDKAYTSHLILEECSVSDDRKSILKYGINGNTYYDIVVEEVDGKIVVNQYVKGTYEKPQIKIILQPLNKK